MGAALVVVLMAAVQATLDRTTVMIVLGITPFISDLLPEGLRLNVDSRGHSFACGFICMGLQMLSGVSGPLLDTFFVRTAMTRHEVVSTKAAVQTLSHATRIGFFGALLASAGGDLGPGLTVLLVASAIAGTSASRIVLDRLSDANFRKLTQRLVLAIGGCYLGWGFWSLAQ